MLNSKDRPFWEETTQVIPNGALMLNGAILA